MALALCSKCRERTRTTTVARGAGFTFERCPCGGLSFQRAQPERGSVYRHGLVENVVDAVGEIEGREQREPTWYQAALLRGLG